MSAPRPGAGPDGVAAAPTVSVVIPVHDYEEFLARTVDSVLAQDPPFLEVVVVDDGSTDASAAVARGFGDRVRVVEQENGGQLSACLTGLARCTSDYVYFLDADDLAVPGFVAAVAPALRGRPAKVQFPLEAVDADDVPTGSVFPTMPAGYGAARMRHDNAVLGFYVCPPTSGNVYRRDVLLGLDTAVLDLRDFIDGPPTLALPYLGHEIVCLDTPLARYRVHGGNHSQWNRPTPERLQGEIDWFDRRWVQVCALLQRPGPPFGSREPAYVLERRLMLAALEGRPGVLLLAVRLSARLARAHLPPTHLLALSLWSLLLAWPSARLRTALVESRRDPSRRPAVVGHALALARRARQVLRRPSRTVPDPPVESTRA